ncbi:acetylornithine/LysW-gamma-L-lysine aminotransferase [Deinococcus sp. HSC-46F16]|uniref:aspartate aminotransferase family protein n=1 Tax=Deinococcus sp. HSC-46F16 TaxID=2910968 RepID=UPI00209CE695|nr:aspartate aminotransferase family protein [Deinococcus sp. HSC-46F16]MCP2014627.1 acetylornithine/LysW-gamma-L-lysine aminotransferase [Deinococcus sp. HSC-46F16]
MTATLDPRTLEARHGTGVYAKRPLTLVRGQGATLWDDAGRTYLDCASGQGVANVGHSHPRVVAAVQAQAATLVTCQEAVYNDVRAAYLSELAGVLLAGLDRIFLCNSGAEAVEAAIKFARASTGRPGVVAAMRGFHGRTLGALSATWEAHYREPFAPLVPEFGHVPYGNLAALEAAITDQTAAVLLEVVQGEGGVRPASDEFLRGAERLCRERGALLLIDEVQTGFGRTGRLFACEHSGLEPDLLILGKAIAGGVPMGAVALGPRVGQMAPGTHGSTFGGNPLACAAARAVLAVMRDENLPAEAARKGEWLLDRLRALPHRRIREVRGLGLMVGLELRDRVAPHLAALQERGVLALPAGPSVLRLLPPLVISDAELEQVVRAVDEVLA